jgi:hypothetical protein
MTSNQRRVAAVAAVLFAAGTALAEDGEPPRVRCQGVNGCKGRSACRSAQNGCAGKNQCRGKGFLLLTTEECQEVKGAASPQKAR